MFKDLFRSADLLDLPLFAMFGFMAVFLAFVIWACSRRRAPHFEHMARMPLVDSVDNEERNDER